ncbi:DUF4260 domain-containing protein [Hyphobacterium sp. CCMP332]|nr:DUF4260 domain-containing protein [Hyphobacterium sp. CCMP332]
MRITLKLEELLMFMGSIFLFSLYDLAWWWFPLLILLPDIGMLGYLINTKVGAISYNIFHHKGIAILIFLLAFHMESHIGELTGIILFAHSSMDRIFGYGLKYSDDFKHTHLGWLDYR